MSQFIAQMFQAGAVTECAAAFLSFSYPSYYYYYHQNYNKIVERDWLSAA